VLTQRCLITTRIPSRWWRTGRTMASRYDSVSRTQTAPRIDIHDYYQDQFIPPTSGTPFWLCFSVSTTITSIYRWHIFRVLPFFLHAIQNPWTMAARRPTRTSKHKRPFVSHQHPNSNTVSQFYTSWVHLDANPFLRLPFKMNLRHDSTWHEVFDVRCLVTTTEWGAKGVSPQIALMMMDQSMKTL
jgi:hypothetical protein